MNTRIRNRAKEILSKLIPDSYRLRYLVHLPRIETWRNKHDEDYPLFKDRLRLYDYLHFEVIQNKHISYLEFGVYKGETIEYWAKINSDSESRFWGFDTFTGLPEKWELFTHKLEKNTFNTFGNVPEIADDRVFFVKGLYQETLVEFLEKQSLSGQLVIHNDADLYSSTLYVLTCYHSLLVPGTILIFDEFSTVLSEFSALEDYCNSYLREYEVLGATKSPSNYYLQVAIRML